MLALFGLFGALFAGVLAESVLAVTEPGSDDDQEDGSDGQTRAEGETIPLDDGDDAIESDDIPDPPEDPLVLHGSNGNDLISGGGGADLITGGAGDDQIDARDGDDDLDGGDGDDILWAGAGADVLAGGAGNDILHGQAGDDSLAGGSGDDSLCGHEGDDSIAGGWGLDTLIGGTGDDTLDGGGDADWLAGGEGDDLLTGGAGGDTLDGGDGDDTLYGAFPEGEDAEVDFLNGGDGDDTLVLGAGDQGSGGAGADVFTLSQWLGEGGFATITDYDAAEDRIVVVYDPAAHAAPELTLAPVEGTEDVRILLDGQAVGLVTGAAGLSAGDITLLAA